MKNIDGLFSDNGFDGIVVLVDDKLHIKEVNTGFESLLDYDKTSVLNKAFTTYILPDEKSFFFDLIYHNDKDQSKTIRLYHASGAFRYFSISVYHFEDSKLIFGKIVKKEFASHGYFDVHNRDWNTPSIFDGVTAKDIFEMIDESDQTLSFLFNVLPIDVWIKDKYGRYVFINQSFIESTSFEKEDVLHKDDYDLFDKRTAKNFVESDYIAIDSKKPLQYLFEAKGLDLPQYTDVTKIPLYNDDSSYIGLLSFAVDVTEIKQVQIQKEQKFNNLDHALCQFDGVIFETDYIGNTYYINGSLVQSLSRKQLATTNIYEIFEQIGVAVKSIKDINAVIIDNETKILTLNDGTKLKLETIAFEALNKKEHKLCIGKVIHNENE